MEQDKAVVYKNPVPEDSYEYARRAAEECPVQAITLR